MAENSKIAWTDHTWNPWIGCTKVSDGCKFCYAEELMDHRYKRVIWGPMGTRVKTSPANWKEPVRWNKAQWYECAACGWRGSNILPNPDEGILGIPYRCPECHDDVVQPARQRVFCASLADVFEDNPQVEEWREELLDLIENTPNLDWLLLTKRPEVYSRVMHAKWYGGYPRNMWAGISVENQAAAHERVPHLAEMWGSVSWVSAEPLLGPIDFTLPAYKNAAPMIEYIDWVIVGGESGAKCRPMQLDWARSLRDQCKAAGRKFFMKQIGGHPDKRDQIADFPEDLQIREFPE